MPQANTKIDRRKALAVVAAVPAAVALGGGVALASVGEPDPILAAIAAHKALIKESHRLYTRLENAEVAARKKHGPRPFRLVAWRNYSAISGGEIDDRREWFLQEPGADKGQVELEYRDAKRRERDAVRAGKEWDKRAGIAPLRQESERANRAARDAAMRLAKMKPTTVAGAGALLDYTRRDLEDGEVEWHMVALRTVASSLAHQGRQS
jgi:hypothetical protein